MALFAHSTLLTKHSFLVYSSLSVSFAAPPSNKINAHKNWRKPAASLLELGGVNINREKMVDDDQTNHANDSIFSKLGVQLHRRDQHPSNFDDVLVPADHLNRSYNDTHYVDFEAVSRSHTCSHQTQLLREGYIHLLVPGDVYQKESIDSTHYSVFHQIEGVRVSTPTDCEHSGINAASYAAEVLKKCLDGLARYLFAAALVLTPIADAATMDSSETNGSLYALADGSIGDWLGGILFSAGQQANVAVQDQLSALSFTSLAVIFCAGLVTSLSPCTLSVLPLTLGYIGAFGSGKSRTEVIGNSIAFAMGLATTLALLGVAASFAGKAYGQIGQGLPVAASLLAVVMGLNLLEVIELQLPSFFDNFDPRSAAANFPSSVQAYLAGLTFALAASPCSTPVLASLLGYAASTRNPVIGGSLLLTYTTGYVSPLLLAASFAGALQSLLSFRKFSAWINPVRYYKLSQKHNDISN